jgi:hypothetical protein
MHGMPGMHGMGMQGMGMHGWMMEQMGPEMGAAMRIFAFAPDHLLAHKDSLGLTPQQVTRLTALRDTAEARQKAAIAEAKPHVQAFAQATDTAALKTHFQAAHDAMGRAHWAMLSAAAQARAVLTDPQRAKAQAWADSMSAWIERHRAMMQGPQPGPKPPSR